jgi:hypothetical protein
MAKVELIGASRSTPEWRLTAAGVMVLSGVGVLKVAGEPDFEPPREILGPN